MRTLANYTQIRRLLAMAALLALALPVAAQEESLKPGINDRFKSEDALKAIARFESESRPIYKHRATIVENLGLKPGMDVADVGAGSGFFTLMMAAEVGDEGSVTAVEISQKFIEHIDEMAEKAELANVKTLLCDDRSTKLPPESVDLVFICDTYHHFEFPYDTMASIHQALRPGGSLVVIDFERVKGISSDWTLGHVRCGKGATTDEIKDAGFDFVEEVSFDPTQYFLKFRKREPKPETDTNE